MPLNPTTAILTNVTAATTSTVLFAPNLGARNRIVFNESTSVCYLKHGIGASTTSYTTQIPAGYLYEFPQPVYVGQVEAIWATANGTARCTEGGS